jgi:hypothetical protein
MAVNVMMGNNAQHVRKKRVYYEGSDTLYEGYALCYNYDTTQNILGWDKGDSKLSDYTADGNQNEGKFIRVEKPATANFPFFAGVVTPKFAGRTGPCWVEVAVPNGAIVNCWTDKSVTAKNMLYLENAQYTIITTAVAGGCVGMATETIDRSSTAGIAQMKLIDSLVDPALSDGLATGLSAASDALTSDVTSSKCSALQSMVRKAFSDLIASL